ncbi:glycoside hydrolase family 19 protein [Sphingomonas abaci]|uniref:Putative chitinase n=1 Tax=Sphingomonas abaci TaxID=237611 RepID=A0A7W7AMU4_9SPHN|nr:glycoside hydrolase family 19 protein [Sphingomonas abaci]MBB4619986.1 putative chitinase [Sphingomonas abaci]
MIDIANLQRRLGVGVDGINGPATMGALFVRCGAPAVIGAELGLSAAVHFEAAGILDNMSRLAHAIAQMGHESDGFQAMEEYASGRAYEGRPDLGNTAAGDGVRFKGRGPIQITGRANYRLYGRRIGIDVERHPEIAAIPSIGLQLSCAYWTAKNLNAFADRDDIEGITRRINGGLNGLSDRQKRLAAAKALLA